MPGPFYFAWVGGAVDPAFVLQTVGDVWSGSLSTQGDLWDGLLTTTGDLVKGSGVINNLADITSLRPGIKYNIQGSGLPLGSTFTYRSGFSITLDFGSSSANGSGVALKITNTTEKRRITNVVQTLGMRIGTTYKITGSGITLGATFTWDGTDTLVLDQDATVTQQAASIEISSTAGLDLIENIGTLAGLHIGQIYSIIGIGIPAGATFTYDGSFNSVQLYQFATGNATQTHLTISKGATQSDGGSFDSTVHAVEDEDILDLEITQKEGEAAHALVQIRNPGFGLLSTSRKQWAWISWDDGTGNIKPLFHGRVIGQPDGLDGEIVKLDLIARPTNFMQQKQTIAKTLRDLPYFDPVWIAHDKIDDPDTVLETRCELFDVDRVTLTVARTNLISGEAGTINIGEAQAIYQDTTQTYGSTPLRQGTMFATVTWDQTAEGNIDLTKNVVKAFQDVGSPYLSPNVGTLTSDGLLTSWPVAGAAIGAGWTMSLDSLTVEATWVQTQTYSVRYLAKDTSTSTSGTSISVQASVVNGSTSVTDISPITSLVAGTRYTVTGAEIPAQTNTTFDSTQPFGAILTYSGPSGTGNPTTDLGRTGSGTLSSAAIATNAIAPLSLVKAPSAISTSGLKTGYKHYDISFNLIPLSVFFDVHYSADRKRSETLAFTLTADIQQLTTDTEGQDIESLTMSSDSVGKTVDLDGTMPIGDPARNSYFATARGELSVQFLLLLMAAKLEFRARAVKIKFVAAWADVVDISCRSNVLLTDYRLPGGQALGKVIAYSLKANGSEGTLLGEVTIGCMIGRGKNLAAAAAGEDDYADDYADDWTTTTGGQVDIVPGTLQYNALDGTYVIDDDGLDLLALTAKNAVKSITIIGGPTDQEAAIKAAIAPRIVNPSPLDAIKAIPTRIALELVPLTGGAFQTNYAVYPSQLAIPQTINLEAT